MSDSELLFISAVSAAALIRRKKLSPVDYMDAVLGAVDRLQPTLNCFITVTAEDARRGAKAAEQAVMSGEPLGPLHGIPVSVKDLIPTKGVRTTFGSIAFADNVPDRDDVLVTRLRAAGAIMIGKTTTPEFGIKGQTDAPIYGVTRNPWNLERTPGGSSGGAAAAVAAGIGPIGLGSDGAGSTRIPAACCGLVGLKGTTGAIPYQEARDAFANVVAAGPLTRTIADCAVMQSVMGGADPMDPWTAHAEPLGRVSPALLSQDLTGLRIGYLSRSAATKSRRTSRKGVEASLDVLQRSRRRGRRGERRRRLDVRATSARSISPRSRTISATSSIASATRPIRCCGPMSRPAGNTTSPPTSAAICAHTPVPRRPGPVRDL